MSIYLSHFKEVIRQCIKLVEEQTSTAELSARDLFGVGEHNTIDETLDLPPCVPSPQRDNLPNKRKLAEHSGLSRKKRHHG